MFLTKIKTIHVNRFHAVSKKTIHVKRSSVRYIVLPNCSFFVRGQLIGIWTLVIYTRVLNPVFTST